MKTNLDFLVIFLNFHKLICAARILLTVFLKK